MYTQRTTKKFEKPQNLTLKKAKLLSTEKPYYIVNVEYFARLLHNKRFDTHLQLRHQHFETLKFVYDTYIKRFVSEDERRQFRQGVIPDRLSAFKTYLSSIATETLRTPRSAKAHRNRFYDCGLIETYFHHDRERRQYWQLNPLFLLPSEIFFTVVDNWVDKAEILLNDPEFPKNQNPLRTALNAIKGEEITPLLSNLDSYSNHKAVDKDAAVPAAGLKTRHNPELQTGTQGKVAKKPGTKKKENSAQPYNYLNKKNNETGKSGVNDRLLFVNPFTKEEVTARLAKISPFLLNLILSFWQIAKESVYQGWNHDQHTQDTVVLMLYENYFNDTTQNLKNQGWLARHQLYVRMLQETHRYCKRRESEPPHPFIYFRIREHELGSTFNFFRTNERLAKRDYERIRREAREYTHGRGKHRDLPWPDVLKIHTRQMVATGNTKYRDLFAWLAKDPKIYQKSYYQKATRNAS